MKDTSLGMAERPLAAEFRVDVGGSALLTGRMVGVRHAVIKGYVSGLASRVTEYRCHFRQVSSLAVVFKPGF